jgi:predicted transcriptional regulator
MDKIKKDIEESGLLKSFIADMVGVSSAHLSMMLNKKATMPEKVRNDITNILEQAKKIAV